MTSEPIPLVDLRVDGSALDRETAAVRRVLARGWFVLGPEVDAFENDFASRSGRKCAIGVGSGTDALTLGMKAAGIGPGDEVIVPDFTAFPTAAAVLEAGATPVPADVGDHEPLLDLDAAVAAIGPRTRAVILVHLYGCAADARRFAQVLESRGVALIEDCAQAQGALLPSGAPVGSAGLFGAFSFYPTKNLGAAGDGGAVVTDDDSLASDIRAWRSHGERSRRYWHELPARNSRLDDVQAAILLSRIESFDEQMATRRSLSDAYAAALPPEARYTHHGPRGAPHLAVIRAPHRDELAALLRSEGIATGVHYPHTISAQPALPPGAHGVNAASWAAECLSLPLHLQLKPEHVERVADAVRRNLRP